jgi:hypothetical protein
MKKTLTALAAIGMAALAFAKLPPPDPAAKAKADETAAKAAWQAKVDAYQLCRVQDRIAAKWGNHASNTAAKAMPVAAKPAASAASGPASAPSAAASSTTPAVASAPPPCTDPGPFAYNPPEQTPLEASGAHSPAGTAASPPSVKQDSGQIQPSGKK